MSKVKEAVLAIFFTLFALSTFAQTGSVRGRIIDAKTKKPLEFVNVSIRTTGTQTPLTGTVSDSTGVFRINRVKNGTYTLTASFIGYKSVEKEFTISPTARNVNVKNILLEEDSQVIDEIKVVGQRAQMRFEIDKKVFDVESNISQAGGSASELLENISSVEVDNEGEISLRGNSSVTIWINGKASGLSADNQAQILEQIPAESIERIELITNPSAKFSPEGTSGIINIILKKNRKAGYYGSLQVGADILGGYNASGSINYSSGKIESYLNVGYRQRKSEGKDNTDRINLDDQGNPVSYLNQKGWNNRDGGSLFTRAGLTLHLTQTDLIGIEGFGHFGNRNSNNTIRYESDVTEEELLAKVRELNNDPDIDGFIVQLPLPKHISEQKVIETIDYRKDVDGFHPINVGRLSIGLPCYVSATPNGILELLRRYNIETQGKKCVILGRSNIVGKPMAMLMMQKAYPGDATVTVCHSRSKDLVRECREADIIIAAMGQPNFVKADMVKEGAVVIDVGTTRVPDATKKSGFKLTGDVKFDEVAPKCSYITPVPGGVGPMTIVSLMKNTLLAGKKAIYKD